VYNIATGKKMTVIDVMSTKSDPNSASPKLVLCSFDASIATGTKKKHATQGRPIRDNTMNAQKNPIALLFAIPFWIVLYI